MTQAAVTQMSAVLVTSMRRPFVVAALVLIVIVLGLELGAPVFLSGDGASGVGVVDESIQNAPMMEASLTEVGEPPGRGLRYLAQIDLLLLLLMAQYAIAQLSLGRIQGRVTGIATLIVSVLVILASVVLLMQAVIELFIMIALVSSPPFGTIAYLAIWGGFDRSTASALLSTLVVLEVVAMLCLVLAHPSFARQKGLLIVGGLSLGLKLVLGFLHALVPRPMVAITDDVGAIITVIVALIVAVFFLVFSLPSIVKALRVDRLA